MFLTLIPQNCGTVIPQWNYNALQGGKIAVMPIGRGFFLVRMRADAGTHACTCMREADFRPVGRRLELRWRVTQMPLFSGLLG